MVVETISDKEVQRKIDYFDLTNLGGGSFFKKLAQENHWTAKFTKRAIKEYKKFIYLAVVSGQRVTPSKAVDKVWHTHLCYTDNYWDEFCTKTLGKTIHHHPSDKTKEAKNRDLEDFEKTLELYRKEFGSEPPTLIWDDSLRRIITAAFGGAGVLVGILWFAGIVPLEYAFGAFVVGGVAYSYFLGASWGENFDLELFDSTDCGSCGSSGSSSSSGGCGGGCGGD